MEVRDEGFWKVAKKRESRRREKLVSFISASLFPTRKWNAFGQGGTTGEIPHETEELITTKAVRTSETMDTFQIHSRKTRTTRAHAP